MKLSKILFGAVAGAAVLGLVSCGGNDDNNMIKGAGSKYKIDYTNTSDEVSRGYKETATKHAGGLVKITFNTECACTVNNDYDNAAGMMGTIFGLENSTSENAPDGAVDFYIMGVSNTGWTYISKYENITDLSAKNFGAKTTANAANGEAKETELRSLTSGNKIDLTNTDGVKTIYLYERALIDGSYDCAFLELTDDEADAFKVEDYTTKTSTLPGLVNNARVNIPGAFDACDEGAQPQKKLAVYANVYAGNTLSGVWNYVNTYKEAEVIE